jgi:exopolysaccharide biosynthesis polyprenyl glycosylphosphotransferase
MTGPPVNEARRRLLLHAFKVIDVLQVVVCFALATILSVRLDHTLTLNEFLALRIKLSNFILFASLLPAWYAIFYWCGLYRSKRLSRRRSEIADLLKAITLDTLLLAVTAVLFPISMVTIRFLGLFWISAAVLMASSRLLTRLFLTSIRKRGRNLRYLLILGTNPRAVAFAQKLEAVPELGYRLVGFVDDDWEGTVAFRESGFPRVANLAELVEFLRNNVVDEVAIYLPLRSFYEKAFGAAALCEQHGILMRVNNAIFDLKRTRIRADDFETDYQISSDGTLRDWWHSSVKRFLDVVISACLLMLLSPFFLIIAVLLKIFSAGPVFFRQERVGLNKRRFLILKFRTMVPAAEDLLPALELQNEASGPVFKIKEDPRITPIGRILRRTSLDELPQLVNVLRGDMSLVGPRPLPVRDYQGFSEDWQRRRFSVRPGITCLWQVTGRSSIPFEQWMKLDLQYLDEWSLWLDMKILAQTVSAVVRGSGAV